MSTLTIRNVVVSVWAGSTSPAVSNPNPAKAHRSASPEASMKTVARTRARPGPRRDDDGLDPAVADLDVLEDRVEQDRDAGLGREPLPGDLEVLGEVGDAGARAVGVRPLHDRPERAQRGHDVVADPADDLARLASPGV